MSYRRLSALVTVATLAFGGTFVVAPLFLPESATVAKAFDVKYLKRLKDGYDANAAIKIGAALVQGVNDALDIYEETSNEVGGLKEGKTVAVGFRGVRPNNAGDPNTFDYTDEIETYSGWIDPKSKSEGIPKSAPLGFLSPANLVPKVQRLIEILSTNFKYKVTSNSFLDQNVAGRYYASHAEKQMLAELESNPITDTLTPDGSTYGGAAAVGVSRPMCPDCQYFYAYEARRIGKDFVVAGAAPVEVKDAGPSDRNNRDFNRRVARYFHSDGRVDVISQQTDGLYRVNIYSAAEVDASYAAGQPLN
jgi:hypothetical protein